MTLNEIANKYNTDKGTDYHGVSAHGYAPIYETYLSKWREDKIRMLEIGVCMEYTEGGQSVRMWHEYFPSASIYTFDIVNMKRLEGELGDRVKFYRGDQGNRTDLETMYKEFGSKEFDFILEDGSHIHNHQMISLAYLFKYIKSGGYYILEDITEEGVHACCQRNDQTMKVIKALQNKDTVTCEFILPEELDYLNKNINKIEIHEDIQNAYRTAIIYKK